MTSFVVVRHNVITLIPPLSVKRVVPCSRLFDDLLFIGLNEERISCETSHNIPECNGSKHTTYPC